MVPTIDAADAALTAVPATLRWHEGRFSVLDQRQLPHAVVYRPIDTLHDGIDAIRTLSVRGAPAIGVAAAYTLAVVAAERRHQDLQSWLRHIESSAAALAAARPTAVNLGWALRRMMAHARMVQAPVDLVPEAVRIEAEDRQLCRGIGEHGQPLIRPGMTVLTHCNAGALAVSALGTATAPLYLAHAAGTRFRVIVDETRPLLQGARLTAWELSRAGIDVTLICDNMAAAMMDRQCVDLVIVGTDRVTRNGDVVNKIGTLNLAVLCQHFGIPFYVACPSSTWDPDTATGAEVVIETRDPDEVRGTAAAHVPVWNPAFDVTPAALVTGIITEGGIARAPLEISLQALLG
jgi:methylthioribose-1-phosphate isomerase